MDKIKCFFLEPTGRTKVALRRYNWDGEYNKCTGKYGHHDAQTEVGEAVEDKDKDGYINSIPLEKYAHDTRWPVVCGCGYVFTPKDEFQVFQDSIYRRTDTGEEMALRDAPAGAIWHMWWFAGNEGNGYSGCVNNQYLSCRLPGGHDWCIDGVALNCDSPCKNCGKPYHMHQRDAGPNGGPNAANCTAYVDARPHHCWVREGVPPLLTVGKTGITCGAGAGSILVPGWHGFLRNGFLEQC